MVQISQRNQQIILFLFASIPFILLSLDLNDSSSFQILSITTLPISNILCIVLPSLIISYFAAKTFTKTNSIPVLLLGCGFLLSGIGSLSAGIMLALKHSPNILVTIHNLGVFLASFCFIISSLMLSTNFNKQINTKYLILKLYLGSIFLISTITFFAAIELTPIFFIQNTGPTIIRQTILLVSVIFYSNAFLFLIRKYSLTKNTFLLSYAMSLLLIGLGLCIIMFQSSIGGKINLIGRLSQYIGHIYALITIVIAIFEAKRQSVSSEQVIAEFFLDGRANYEALVETLKIPIISVNANQKVFLWNTGAELFFNIKANDALGKNFTTLITFKDQTIWNQEVKKNYIARKEFRSTIITAKHNNVPVEVLASSRNSSSGLITTYIIYDISERVSIENELSRLSSLDLVGEMAAAMGHEVRNPLTTVRGFLQMLNRNNNVRSGHYDLMLSEIDRANNVITEYLSLAKNKSSVFTFEDLELTILKIYPLIEAVALEKGTQIKFVTDGIKSPSLYLDSKEIKQLIINLAKNAIEASPTEKGKVTIMISSDNCQAVLSVSDNGPGIAPEVLKKLGTPFVTTKNEGNGLGLAVCYRIISRHKATLSINTDSQGTTFTIKFPIKGNYPNNMTT